MDGYGSKSRGNACRKFIFRFPKQFDTLLALSGIYDTELFYGDYHDEKYIP